MRYWIFFLSQGVVLNEVEVSAQRNDNNVNKAQVGIINIPMREIKNLPVLAGERDIMKVLHFLPGVQQAQEGTSGFLVRGAILTKIWYNWMKRQFITQIIYLDFSAPSM